MQYKNIPSGAVLKRILAKKNISQKHLSELTGILPQRVNDYITNKRRFTVGASMKIENALNIGIPGFFYLIQSNHDVYLMQSKAQNRRTPDLSKFRKSVFWDFDVTAMDWDLCKRAIVQRCFEYGNEKEISEIIAFYGKEDVKNVLDSIDESWKSKDREQNYNKYLL